MDVRGEIADTQYPRNVNSLTRWKAEIVDRKSWAQARQSVSAPSKNI
jgi:hypothetical protein